MKQDTNEIILEVLKRQESIIMELSNEIRTIKREHALLQDRVLNISSSNDVVSDKIETLWSAWI